MLRRYYHVCRALSYPRVSSRRPETFINAEFTDPDSRTQSSPAPPANIGKDSNPDQLYIPTSKQLFSNIAKPTPPRNIVEVSSDVTDVTVVNEKPNFLRYNENMTHLSKLPEPLFMEKRMEHYHSEVPQRISTMKFEEETAEREFEGAQSLFELRTAIKVNLPIMDHINFLDALTAFHRLISVVVSDEHFEDQLRSGEDRDLDRTYFTREEILNLPEFVVVVKGLVKYCRDFSADEALEASSKMLDLKLPVDSLPIQLFLELLKTHINQLTVNQLVGLIKRLSIAAELAADESMTQDVEGGDVAQSSMAPSIAKLMATLMATERLILLRFEEEHSWLSCSEVIDIVSFVRESELRKDLYRDAMAIILENRLDLTMDSILQYCRWIPTQSPNSVIREDGFEGTHEILFPIFCDIFFENLNEITSYKDKLRRRPEARVLLSAIVEVCSFESCVKMGEVLDVDNLLTPQFCHASYDVSIVGAFARRHVARTRRVPRVSALGRNSDFTTEKTSKVIYS